MSAISWTVLCVWSFIAGGHIALWVAKKAAVRHGHAEYYFDRNQRRQWRWKETP